MNYLFTSESVSEGHPDKVADQISDAILDEFLKQDPEAKVACETFCSTGLVVVGGEVRSEDAYVDIQSVARRVINRIGYNKAEYMFDGNSCGVLSALHEQSQDINRGVDVADPEEQGAGDQGMMFGYACCDTDEYMPLPLALSHKALQILARIRKEMPELMPYLRPDSKSQFTIEYDGDTGKPVRVHTIVISTQHDEFVAEELGHMTYREACDQYGQDRVDAAMQAKIRKDVQNILIPMLIEELHPETAALFKDDYIHRTENHRGHLRRQRSARRRCIFRERPFKSRQVCSLCRKIHRQKHGRCRCRPGNACPAGLCYRRSPACKHLREHIRHRGM